MPATLSPSSPSPRAVPPGKISYQQFLQWLDADTWAEWVDGEVHLMSPISGEHQDVGRFLLAILQVYITSRQLGVLRYEPFQMKTGPELPGRSPDILFVRRHNQHRLQPTFLDGPADLVVEILSPDSEHRDRVVKLAEYARGGVPEYWIIDPHRRHAEFYLRDETGTYQLRFGGSAGRYDSLVVEGFWLQVEWLWNPPPEIQIIRLWGLI